PRRTGATPHQHTTTPAIARRRPCRRRRARVGAARRGRLPRPRNAGHRRDGGRGGSAPPPKRTKRGDHGTNGNFGPTHDETITRPFEAVSEEKIMAMATSMVIDALPERAIRELEERLRGAIVRPGDAGYDQARRVWNATVDRYPALIVRPREVADVIQAVDFARTNGLPLAVRGGGHSPAGYGTVDGGVVVDFADMKQLDIDSERRVAWAGPGLTWGEYNARAGDYGLATPGVDVASVGIAGATLGGGMGWLMRKHGLTIDNLLAVDVVTADGRLVMATETENPDLFWALRGGG